MDPNRTDEEIFAEILSKKLDEQWQNFLLECAKILVAREFEKIPNKSEMTTISLKIEVRKQNTTLRTKVDFDTF